MKKTIISHFYNEQYLLPWWLTHHLKYFDDGIMINYASNDSSVEIIKFYRPNWTIIDSKNEFFDATLIDKEVMEIEKTVTGWKACLNITEFLVGDYSVLNDVEDQELKVPCFIMVDENPDVVPNYNFLKSLTKQKTHGIHYQGRDPLARRPRLIHNKHSIDYPLGRHYPDYDTEALKVCWYGWSPFNAQTIKRKTQIQNRIPNTDKIKGFGTQHFVNEQQLRKSYQTDYYPYIKDLSKEII